jgi:hypothetical protein
VISADMETRRGGIMRTRFIRLFPVLLAVLLLSVTEVYAQIATVVTHSGQRFRGQVVSVGGTSGGGYGNGNGNYGNYGNGSYDNGSYGDVVVVRVNGRDRQIPFQDVALIDFAGNGTVSQNELRQANQSYDGLVVLRNGRTVAGRIVDFQGYNNQAVIAGQFGDRTIPLNQVARVYFGNDSTAYNNGNYQNPDPYYDRNVSGNYGNVGQYGQPAPYGQPVYGTARTVTVPTNQTWTNSGVDVRRGDVIHFRASGNVSLSHNPGDYGTPAGANDGRLAGNSPLPGVTGGLLIGRVGNSLPFAIGGESDITMTTNGRLYLGVNDDVVGDNSGNFVVEMFPR